MKILSLEEIQTFLHCPQKWMYRYYYNVDYPLKPEELFSKCMTEVIRFFFASILSVGDIEFHQVSTRFEEIWTAAGLRARLPDATIDHYARSGLATLIELYNKIRDNINIVAVGVKWASTWKTFDVKIEGESIALLQGSLQEGKEDESAFYVVEVVPTFADWRRNQTALQAYHLPRSAISREISEFCRDEAAHLALIDLNDASIRVYPPIYMQDYMPVVATALNQMVDLSVLPHSGNWCKGCQYSSVCNTKHISNTSLKATEKTRQELESVLCPITIPKNI